MAWRKNPEPIGYRVRRPMTLWGRKREIDDYIPAAEVASLTRREALVRSGRLNPVYATEKQGDYETLRGNLRKKRDGGWQIPGGSVEPVQPILPDTPDHPAHPDHPGEPSEPSPPPNRPTEPPGLLEDEEPSKVQYPADKPYPTMSWPKADMLGWMTSNFPEISQEGTKEELLARLDAHIERV